jgi:hypothetical protein
MPESQPDVAANPLHRVAPAPDEVAASADKNVRGPEWTGRPIYDRILEVRALIHDPATDVGFLALAEKLFCNAESVRNYYHASFASPENLEALRKSKVAFVPVLKEGRANYRSRKASATLTPAEAAALGRMRARKKVAAQPNPQPAAALAEQVEDIPGLPPISAAPFNSPAEALQPGVFIARPWGVAPNPMPDCAPGGAHVGAENFVLPGARVEAEDSRNSSLPDLDAINQAWCNMLNWSGCVDHKPAPPPLGQRVKIVSAGDFHVPFQHDKLIDRLIQEESADTDILYVPGDFFDGFNFSRFDKPKRETHPAAEFQKGQEIMHRLATAFRRVRVIPGNHDIRVFKAMLKTPDGSEFIELFTAMLNTGITPLERVCSFYPNVEIVEPAIVECAEFSFLTQIGDLVLGHAEIFSQIPAQAANRFALWLHKFSNWTGFTDKVRVVGQAHTHQFGCVRGDFGWNVELGSMSRIPGYVGSAKCLSPRPPARGYCVFIQYGGVTNMEEFSHKFDDSYEVTRKVA